MTELRIHPLGEIDCGTFEQDGETFAVLRLEDRRAGDRVEIVMHAPAFVTLVDHLKMVADDIIDEQQPPS